MIRHEVTGAAPRAIQRHVLSAYHRRLDFLFPKTEYSTPGSLCLGNATPENNGTAMGTLAVPRPSSQRPRCIVCALSFERSLLFSNSESFVHVSVCWWYSCADPSCCGAKCGWFHGTCTKHPSCAPTNVFSTKMRRTLLRKKKKKDSPRPNC